MDCWPLRGQRRAQMQSSRKLAEPHKGAPLSAARQIVQRYIASPLSRRASGGQHHGDRAVSSLAIGAPPMGGIRSSVTGIAGPMQ